MWDCIATDNTGRVHDHNHDGPRWHFVSGKKGAEQSKAFGISNGCAACSAKMKGLSWPAIVYNDSMQDEESQGFKTSMLKL